MDTDIGETNSFPRREDSKASSLSAIKVNGPVGHIRQSEIVTIEERLRKLQEEYSLASSGLSRIRQEYDDLLKKCRTIKLLLISYYNLEEDDTDNLLVPERGTPYWYVRATFGRSYFDVCQSEWIGGISDKFRYCRGNFFLEEQTANLVCNSCNALMARL